MTTENEEQKTGFEGWAIIEVFGHRRLAGMVREVEVFGTKMLRIDTVECEERTVGDYHLCAQPSVTQFYSGSSLFSVTPATKDACEAVARDQQARVYRPLALPAPEEDADDGRPF